MTDLSTGLLVAGISLVLGHVAGRWWNRAHPVILIRQFSEGQQVAQKAVASSRLAQLTQQSWIGPTLVEGPQVVGEFVSLLRGSEEFLDLVADSAAILERARPVFEKSTDDSELLAVLKNLLNDRGIDSALEMGFVREELAGLPAVQSGPPRLHTAFHKGEDGETTLVVAFDDATVSIGQHLDQPWRAERLMPLKAAISVVDRSYFAALARSLGPLLAKQSDIARQVRDMAKPIVDHANRWIAEVVIVNTGGSPLIIWPEVHLEIFDSKHSARYQLECDPLVHDKSGELTAASGPVVLAAGERLELGCATRQARGELSSGGVLGQLYQTGAATAQLHWRIERAGWPFGDSVASRASPFKPVAEEPPLLAPIQHA